MTFNLQLTRGDTAVITGTVTLTTGGVEAPYPIAASDKVRFAAKRHYEDPDSAAVFYLSSPTRVEVLDGPNGVIRFSIQPGDYTAAFPDPIRKSVALVGDVQVSNAAGTTVYTLAQGMVTVAPDVTALAP